MWKRCVIFAVLFFLCLSGISCMTTDQYAKVDEITARIKSLEATAAEKMAEAKAGTLTITEALEWARYSAEQVETARNELRDLQGQEGVSWPELLGAFLASVLGATGLVRAWRGPSSKTISGEYRTAFKTAP